MEKAVRFTNEKGHTLHGILHLPDDPATMRSVGMLWLSAGQKVRQGAGRMNVTIARRLAAMGPGATLARAVEPQPLYAEGKVHLTRAEQVELALLGWLEALDQP